MRLPPLSALLVSLLFATPALPAADLVLADAGKSEYQIVLPDHLPTPSMTDALQQVARLVQTAFHANGVEVPVVRETEREAARPALFLGDTAFARAHEVKAAELPGWSYVLRVVGRDVIIAGHDQPSPVQPLAEKTKTPYWDRVGTGKAAADFLRQYAGTRFLYPEISAHAPLGNLAKFDLLQSPGLEFLPTPVIAIPADLNVRKSPVIEFNTGGTQTGGFYDLANNRFPFVETAFGTHTYSRAIPVAQYYDKHPEYFALIRTAGGGPKALSRVKDDQYCISNPEVQELIYQDLLTQIDRGYATVDLGQPDGFRPCQCEECAKLYGVGDDWSEKIWILHRGLAERVLAARPQARVMILSYILTAAPPKTFQKFPANTMIMWTGTNDTDIARWKGVEVPGGFTGYVYNWCPNLGTNYTPMRTPLFVETQVKRLVENRVQGIKRDGAGLLYGLEGPVYYTMGRMFDDAGNLRASDLVTEFCEAAFGKSARPMQRFYDQLYHGVELYSEFLGTRAPAWHYLDIYDKKHKYLSDPYQLLGFLYPPKLLTSLESELAQAELAANTDKIKARLTLVRREFDYVKALARVIHLTQAYETQPDLASRDRLLDAIDARNAQIGAYYDARGRALPLAGWAYPIFPTLGHQFAHLKLAHNGYQEPFEETSVNWDTKAMRAAPPPGTHRLLVHTAPGSPPALDSAIWKKAAGFALGPQTTLRALHDHEALYLRVESELPPETQPVLTAPGEPDLRQSESLDVYLAPIPSAEKYYRFMVGPAPAARWDAAAGLIAEAMDPRHGRDDPGWNGEWLYKSRIDKETHHWLAFLRIPFQTLGVEPPAAGAIWHGYFGRVQVKAPGETERAIWSTQPGHASMDDRTAFGEIAFD